MPNCKSWETCSRTLNANSDNSGASQTQPSGQVGPGIFCRKSLLICNFKILGGKDSKLQALNIPESRLTAARLQRESEKVSGLQKRLSFAACKPSDCSKSCGILCKSVPDSQQERSDP